MPDALEPSDLDHVLTLVELAAQCETSLQLRTQLLHGVSALIPALNVAWTEVSLEDIRQGRPCLKLAETTESNSDLDELVPLFCKYAGEHPAIRHVMASKADRHLVAVSDVSSEAAFLASAFYRGFFGPQQIRDQLSVGLVVGGKVLFGISINRQTWGFGSRERALLARVGACTLPWYLRLKQAESSDVEWGGLQAAGVELIPPGSAEIGITRRQAEILGHVAKGLTNAEIGAITGLSEGTVRKHLENCFRRLGVSNRVEAVITAMDRIEQASSQRPQDLGTPGPAHRAGKTRAWVADP